MKHDLESLTALFKKLRADNPESWATSQISEGINQLGRFLFLREAWKKIVKPDDSSWISAMIQAAKDDPDGPGSGAGPALERMLAAGVSEQDITETVRVAQWELLFDFCCLLADPNLPEQEVADLSWQLVELDRAGNPLKAIDGLHESVLEMDPTGNEMRPS